MYKRKQNTDAIAVIARAKPVSLPERLEGFISSIDRAETVEAVFLVLQKEVALLGFDYFSYWVIWSPDKAQQSLCITNYPAEWSRHFRHMGYSSFDYVGRYAAKSTLPFIWSIAAEGGDITRQQKIIFAEGAELGLKSGGTIPIHGPGATKATFSVAAQSTDTYFSRNFEHYRHDIHLMAAYVHEKVTHLNLGNGMTGALELSAREIEILTWSARGKSSWEISVILSISEETTRKHLDKVRTKLGAANTTHAIAIALMNGIICP